MPARREAPVAAARPAPRRRGLPIVGATLDYVRDPLRMMRAQYDGYGPVSEIDFLGGRWTVLLGPDACGEGLQNADKAFASGPGWGSLVGPFFDRGLMLLDFDEHRRHRRLMLEAFTRPRLAGYTAALGPAVAAGLDAWEPGPGFRVYPALKELTLDLATQVFMGGADLATPDELDEVNRAFVACVQAATALVRLPIPGTRWGRALAGRRLLEDFFGRHLASKRARPGDDLFSVLCGLRDEDGTGLSDEDVVNHMIFLLMAAHDTSTITVTSMMRHLGAHPEWRERLREEAAGLPDCPDLDELDRLESFDLVMKECLRLLPPVPVVARRTVKETEVLGVHIPADRLVAVMLHLGHHMPEYWPDPERFDPERFAAHRREDKVHRHAWEPFGGGVHKCLGMAFAGAEVKLIVHQMLRRFDWTVDADYRDRLNYHSLPFPADGQPVDLRPRERTAAP
ncbi:MAG: cytochrome [Marmoricola sp.]|jgi:cytochrome P450|nr:cytochrome [Marmoricola sp.]